MLEKKKEVFVSEDDFALHNVAGTEGFPTDTI
jgi:hypothetical protein